MLIVLGVLLAVFVLSKNNLNPSPNKSTLPKSPFSPTLVISAPDFYASTGTDIIDNPPTTSINLNPPTISKPSSNLNTLGYYNGVNPSSTPDNQLALYQNDAAQIAPTPPPNRSFESVVPEIASALYVRNAESVTPRWLV